MYEQFAPISKLYIFKQKTIRGLFSHPQGANKRFELYDAYNARHPPLKEECSMLVLRCQNKLSIKEDESFLYILYFHPYESRFVSASIGQQILASMLVSLTRYTTILFRP